MLTEGLVQHRTEGESPSEKEGLDAVTHPGSRALIVSQIDERRIIRGEYLYAHVVDIGEDSAPASQETACLTGMLRV